MWNQRRLLMSIGEVKPPPLPSYIKFADKEVERICVESYSSDGIGVTHEDAEKVISFKANFNSNNLVKSFNELNEFKNIKEIYTRVFKNSSFTSILLPSGVETIQLEAFMNCKGLNLIPNSIIELKNAALFNSGVEVINLPNLVKLEGRCFSYCSNLKRVENLGKIKGLGLLYNNPDNGDFAYCSNMEFIRLPKTITDIANQAFSGCNSIKIVICEAEVPPTLGNTKFTSPVIESVYVPDSSVDTYKTASNWSAYADKIKPLSEYIP